MKKFISLFLVVILSIFSVTTFAVNHHRGHSRAVQNQAAEDTVNLHFFWSKDCPHCVAAHPFIDKLKAQYPWLRVHTYEISGNSHNSQLFEKMARDHGKETSFVPTFFVGDKMIVGYTNAQSTGTEIRNAVLENHNKKA